ERGEEPLVKAAMIAARKLNAARKLL
ncbi:hypothetical protein A2U01_0069311, partial [Trifolium medium]|nr:hypothetical protein [Trifolium medium]